MSDNTLPFVDVNGDQQKLRKTDDGIEFTSNGRFPSDERITCPWCEGECMVSAAAPHPVSIEVVRKLVRDAYDEGYGLGLNFRHSNIVVNFEDSLASQVVDSFLGLQEALK